MSKIKIIIVDDHKLFRDGILSLFQNDEYIEVAGATDSAENALSIIEETNAQVVLMDISWPGIDGLTAIKDYTKKHPHVKFIVLTMHAEGQYVVKAVKNGAFGYLLKNTSKEELSEAIFAVCKGEKYFNQKVSQLMVGNITLEGSTVQPLSKRETEVLQLITNGKTNKEIAQELFVSVRTVETHRVNMMKKMNVTSMAELIKKAVKMKLV